MAEVFLSNVLKRYPGGVVAVKDLDLEIQDGEFMVLVGPSGCGKSTTLRMVAGLEDITEGELRIGGRVVNDVPPRGRDIAMVFQSYALYPHMTVFDNMAFGLKIKRMPKQEIQKRVDDAAEMLGLTELLGRKPKALSGGQRQRVAMGRAIVRQPSVFLFDEPLSNLDARLRVQMRLEIASLHRRLSTTIIYVTHDQVEAMTLADRIAIMSMGLLQQVGTPLEVYTRPRNKFVAGFIGSPEMNFIRGEVDEAGDDLAFVGADVSVTLDGASGVGALSDVELGVRPQHITTESDAPDGHGVVEHVEKMGAETFAHLNVGETMIVARLPGERQVAVGDRLSYAFDRKHLHLFDAEGVNLLVTDAAA